MIFVICPCKSPNLVKTQTNLADNLKSNWVPWNPWNNFLFTILLHLIFLYSTSLFFTFAFSAIPTIRSHKVFLGSVHIIPWKAFFCSQNKNLAIWFRRGSTFLSPVSCHMSLMPTSWTWSLPLLTPPLCTVGCCCWSWPWSINNEWQRPFFSTWRFSTWMVKKKKKNGTHRQTQTDIAT